MNTVRMTHEGIDEPIHVLAPAVRHHEKSGWKVADDDKSGAASGSGQPAAHGRVEPGAPAHQIPAGASSDAAKPTTERRQAPKIEGTS